ncbi:hypothetical protein LguiA_032553 [Lonicera macranthoides]
MATVLFAADGERERKRVWGKQWHGYCPLCCLMCLVDLYIDFINPYGCAALINKAVLLEFVAQSYVCSLQMATGHWFMFLMCLLDLLYNVKLYIWERHLMDVSVLFKELKWEKKSIQACWYGPRPVLIVTETELIKEILNNKEGFYPKPRLENYAKKLVGDGLVASEGEKWSKLRKLANHTFHAESLKFYRIFYKSADDIESDKTEQVIRDSVTEIIEKREKRVTMKGEKERFGSDFLGSLIRAKHDNSDNMRISVEDIIDECKTFYISGQETTTTTLYIWIGKRERNEVLELFGRQKPNSEGIARLKNVRAIRHRLSALQHNPEIWGKDALLFKPERFAEAVAKATNNNTLAFLAFGFGPLTCVGSSFASTEAKIALSMIIQRYKFTDPYYIAKCTICLYT